MIENEIEVIELDSEKIESIYDLLCAWTKSNVRF